MQKLELKKKTGFRVLDPNQPVVIDDHRGIPFYNTLGADTPITRFNLPPGTYFVKNGTISPMPFPVSYKLVKLPILERWLPKPTNFVVTFAPNPNKCTINWLKRTITFDNSFKEQPLSRIFSILFHEWGHHLYNTEKYADLFAVNEMLRYGFNPFNVKEAPINTLSNNAFERKVFIVRKMIESGLI